MAKYLVHDYTFTPAENKIVIDYVYKQERFLIITNVTSGITMFQFNVAGLGFASISYDYDLENTTVILDFDCSAMSSADKLQIFIEQDAATFQPTETFTDPVSKFRVSQPENLIDTDFEYGLQSTKWETLELVKNIPTFFARNGDINYEILDITTVSGSDQILVTLNEDHNLLPGSPVIVQGTDSITADGTFVVTQTPSTTTLRYKAKAVQGFTGSIYDTVATLVFPGSRYQGTEFTLNNIDTITTDAGAASTLTVSTEFPTNFVTGTSFYLTNSVAPATYSANAAAVITATFDSVDITRQNNAATGETGFALGSVQPYAYAGTNTLYFDISQCTVNVAADTIAFPTAHGLEDNRPYLYVPGELNTTPGLTANTIFFVRVIDSTTVYFTTARNSTSRVNLTSTGASAGVMRSALIRAYQGNGANITTEAISFSFETAATMLAAVPDRNTPMLMWTTTMGGLTISSTLFNPPIFFKFDNYLNVGNQIRFSTIPGGALFNLTSAAASGFMIPVSLLPDRWSMYFPDHGLDNGDAVTLTVVSGSSPTAAGVYGVSRVNEDRILFLNSGTGAVTTFANAGSQTANYQITATPATLLNDSIPLTAHEIPDGTALIYNNGGNADIGGLTSGSTYYSFASTDDTIKLANNDSGYASAAKTFTQNTVQVNLSTNQISLSQTGNHGYTTGDIVQYLSSTPIGGLRSGGFYYARVISATVISLHSTSAGATANTDLVILIAPLSGSGTIRKSTLVDLTATSTGTHTFSSSLAGASDGVYSLSNVVSSNSFALGSNVQIGNRTFTINQGTLDLKNNALRLADHYLTPGTTMTYTTTGNAVSGLTNGNTYYVIRTSQSHIQLADTAQDAVSGNAVVFTSQGDGTQTLSTPTITGEVTGAGNVTIANAATLVSGTSTLFNAVFVPGDSFNIYGAETLSTIGISTANTTTDVFTANATTTLTTQDAVIMSATTAPAGTTNNFIYYVNVLSSTTFTLHNTPADATANANIVNITTAGTAVEVLQQTSIGNTFTSVIDSVNSSTEIVLTDSASTAYTNANYGVTTGLFVRADGFALHRPYDGGVELVPSTNPDATMIRQTRKYFRYQSGKGIQVSFAVNFSPSTAVDQMTWADVSGTPTATVTTRYPHRLTAGLDIVISGATVSSGTNYWNGDFVVASTPTASTFTVTLAGEPVDPSVLGLPEYYVDSWANSLLKCGLFDDQNGLYFEYDGQNLNCCRRSSTLQISGTVSVQFKSGAVVGTGTKFTSQLAVDDYIVIKGQSYRITEITNDNLFYILPSYRGIDATKVIVTKTIDTKVPQDQWNIDTCVGTGPSGYFLDIHTIQMAYMDYSWYGAGKVRFGFKDQTGRVIYVHQFIHNNNFREAYMRSGNLPARYEIENVGTPTYVPALAHWGTSVIMDGRFDDDRAYVFTASSQQLTVTGTASLVISGNVETQSTYQIFSQNQYRTAGFAVRLATANVLFNNISSGLTITGNGLAAGTVTRIPQDSRIQPQQSYQAGVDSRINFSNQATRNLLIIDRQPSSTAATNNYTVTLSSAVTTVTYEQPLISIRLAPSVDTGAPGLLGSREIINRMQLILNSVGILTTHAVQVTLRLNGLLNGYDYQRVTNPSLSQLIYHDTDSRIAGGTEVYSFRAQGGTGSAGRTPVLTQQDLGEIATLGNSILGGDNVFPDGPDVLTVTVQLVEDPGFVSTSNPWNVTGRISWSESQA